jgi:hypothetical protein
MPGAIVLTGFSSDDPVPGAYLEINFAQGEAAGSGSPIEVLLMGNKLPGGAATVDTVVYGPDTPAPLQTESDAIALFGAGSELHRMFRAFTKVNQRRRCARSPSRRRLARKRRVRSRSPAPLPAAAARAYGCTTSSWTSRSRPATR